MFIDDTLATAIGGAFLTVSGGVGWAYTRAWKRGDNAQRDLKKMLEFALTDTEKRGALWDRVREVIVANTEAVKDVKRDLEWTRAELTRLAGEIQRLGGRS